MKFSLFPNFKNELIIDYNSKLNGLRTFSVIMTTGNKDPDANNKYNFVNSTLWDTFWFDEQSRMLLNTNSYVLGEEQL